MTDDATIEVVDPRRDRAVLGLVTDLLAERGLGRDDDVELFVVARRGDHLIGCVGLAGTVVKCTAVSPAETGTGIAARLMAELQNQALDRGRPHLLVYTQPSNREAFTALGYRPIAEVPGLVTLLENTPFGLSGYCERLRREEGLVQGRVGAIVMHANPFTLGHQHLVRTAAQQCARLHVWVVAEEGAMFSAADRLSLVRAGCAALPEAPQVRVHAGTAYLVSRATFPEYFLRDPDLVDQGVAGLDVQLFRRHIGPALGITDRYVGTEPLSPVTARYNQELRRWLESEPMEQPPITVHEVPRLEVDQTVVSASRVRSLLGEGRLDEVAALVPATTLAYLRQRYTQEEAR